MWFFHLYVLPVIRLRIFYLQESFLQWSLYLFESDFLISPFKIEYESLWALMSDNINTYEDGRESTF